MSAHHLSKLLYRSRLNPTGFAFIQREVIERVPVARLNGRSSLCVLPVRRTAERCVKTSENDVSFLVKTYRLNGIGCLNGSATRLRARRRLSSGRRLVALMKAFEDPAGNNCRAWVSKFAAGRPSRLWSGSSIDRALVAVPLCCTVFPIFSFLF